MDNSQVERRRELVDLAGKIACALVSNLNGSVSTMDIAIQSVTAAKDILELVDAKQST